MIFKVNLDEKCLMKKLVFQYVFPKMDTFFSKKINNTFLCDWGVRQNWIIEMCFYFEKLGADLKIINMPVEFNTRPGEKIRKIPSCFFDNCKNIVVVSST